MRLMNGESERIVDSVIELARRQCPDSDMAVLCKAVLHLYKQTGQLHSNALEAFEQIEELDRRQGPGDD